MKSLSAIVLAIAFCLSCAAVAHAQEEAEGNALTLQVEAVAVLGDSHCRHASDVTHIEPLSDGLRALSTSRDGAIRLWDLKTGKELRRYLPEKGDDVWNVKLLPGEREFLSCGDDLHATRWDLNTGAILAKYKLPSTGMRLAIVPSGKQFVACDSGRTASLWDIASGDRQVIFKGHKESVYSAAVSPDGKICVTCGEDGTVRGWDVASGKQLWVIEKVEPEEPDGGPDPFGGGGGPVPVDPFGAAEPPKKVEPKELGPGHAEDVYTVCFLPDGKHVVSCSGDSAVSMWNASDGKLIWSESVTDSAKVVACNPDGTTLAVTCDDSTLHLLSTKDGRSLRVIKLPGDAHWAVAWSHDGKRLLSGGDHLMYQWEADTGKQLSPPPANKHVQGAIEAIAISPRGDRLFAATEGGSVHVWDLKTREQTDVWAKPMDDVTIMHCSPDGKLLWLLGDGRAALHTDTGGVTHSINLDNGLEAATVSVGGKLIMGAQWNGQVIAWDAATGDERFRTPAHEEGDDLHDIAASDAHLFVIGEQFIEMRKLAGGASVTRLRRTSQGSAHAASLPGDRGLLLMGAIADQPRLIPLLPSVARDPRPLADKQIEKLVAELGHEQFLKREQAMNSLIAGGEQVLTQLASDSDDTEVRWRLEKIRDRVREGLLPTSFLKPVELKLATRSAGSHPSKPIWAMTAGYDCRATLQLGGIAGQAVQLSQLASDGHSPACVAFSADGTQLFTGNRDGTVSIFRLK